MDVYLRSRWGAKKGSDLSFKKGIVEEVPTDAGCLQARPGTTPNPRNCRPCGEGRRVRALSGCPIWGKEVRGDGRGASVEGGSH